MPQVPLILKGTKDFMSFVTLKGLDFKLDLGYLAYFANLSLNLKCRVNNYVHEKII